MLKLAIHDAGGEIPEILSKYREKDLPFKFSDKPFETAARFSRWISDKVRAAEKI